MMYEESEENRIRCEKHLNGNTLMASYLEVLGDETLTKIKIDEQQLIALKTKSVMGANNEESSHGNEDVLAKVAKADLE